MLAGDRAAPKPAVLCRCHDRQAEQCQEVELDTKEVLEVV